MLSIYIEEQQRMTKLLYHTDSYLQEFTAKVANTHEVGPLKIFDNKSKGRINKRLVVALDAFTL